MYLSHIDQDLYRTSLDSSSAGGFVFGKYKEELLFEIKDHRMDQMVPENTTKKSVERLTALVSMILSYVF